MEFLPLILFNTLITLFIVLIYDNVKLNMYVKELQKIYRGGRLNFSSDVLKSSHNEEVAEVSEESISSYEEERLEREREFDERIKAIKNELEYTNPIKGYEAQILDPMVYNLPHDTPIPEMYDGENEVSN